MPDFKPALPGENAPAGERAAALWPMCGFVFFIVASAVFSAGLVSAAMLYMMFFVFVYWVYSRRPLPRNLRRIIVPLLLMLLIGTLGGAGRPLYDVLKDVWYVGNAALMLVAGYVLMANLRSLRRLFLSFVIAGSAVSALHLLHFAFDASLLDMSVDRIRQGAGTGYFVACAALVLLAASWHMRLPLFGRHRWLDFLAFALCSSSLVLSFSRTIYISFFLLAAVAFGWVRFDTARRIGMLILAGILLLAVAILSPPQASLSGKPTFMEKMLFSLEEVRVREYSFRADINSHWRGYETARALRGYAGGNPMQYVSGQGFGATVDLGLYMPLGGEKIRYAPTLHNGYMYLLFKTGLAGVALYLGLLIFLLREGGRHGTPGRAEEQYAGRVLAGLVLVYLYSTFTIAGMFNKVALLPMTLLLGALVCYLGMEGGKKVDCNIRPAGSLAR